MLLIAAISALCALIWLAVWLRWLGIPGGIILSLLCGVVVGHPFFHRNVGPIPVTSDRVLLGVVAVLAVLLIRFGKAHLPPLTRANAVAVTLVVFLLISALTHDWKVNRFHPLATWLFFYAAPLAAFLLVQCTEFRYRHAVMLFGAWGCLACYLGIVGVCETREWSQLVWPRYITDASYSEFFGRARGPLLNPIGNGILLTVGLAAAMILAVRLKSGMSLLPLAVAVVCAAGIYLTRTRSVWLGAAAAAWMIWIARVPRRVSVATTMIALVMGCLLIATQWERLNAFKRDRDVSVAEMSESASLRPILATIAWKMFQDHPMWGVGFGQYQLAAQPYCGDRDTPLPLDKGRPFVQHNVFLSLLTETGLFGLALFVAFLAMMACNGIEVIRSQAATAWERDTALLALAAMAAYCVNGMFHEVAIIPMTHYAFFTLLGILAALHGRVSREQPVLAVSRWRSSSPLFGPPLTSSRI